VGISPQINLFGGYIMCALWSIVGIQIHWVEVKKWKIDDVAFLSPTSFRSPELQNSGSEQLRKIDFVFSLLGINE